MDTRITDRDRKAARNAAKALARISPVPGELMLEARVRGKRAPVALPAQAVDVLKDTLKMMARGRQVTIHSREDEVTTEGAAAILGVSRPHVIKLIRQGKLPFRKVGTHRRIRRGDVVRLRESQDAARRALLAKLAEESQDLNLGY